MRIGIPREIKNGEHRVAITPGAVRELSGGGHQLLIEQGAGIDSGYEDADYAAAGAVMATAADAWGCELVVKVKEPLESEYNYLNSGSALFTFLHLAAFPELTRKLLAAGSRAIGYETVQLDHGGLPILAPMSKVAGRVSMLMAARFLQFGSFHGHDLPGVKHRGMLMGGIRGIDACRVVILGGGNVGRHAAYVANGLEAEVVVLDHNEGCISHLNGIFGERVQALLYSESDLGRILAAADVVIGAALIPGEHAPVLITEKMIEGMRNGSVFMDVAIDQGGISRTSRVTSYDDPVYAVHGVIHSCLPNLPAAVPRSSTQALVAASLPYLKELAANGIEAAVAKNRALKRGINTWDGEIRHPGVRKALAVE